MEPRRMGRCAAVAAAAVLLAAPAAGSERRPPKDIWYRFVLVGETSVRTSGERHLLHSPAESRSVERRIEWLAESRTATILTQSGRDVSVTAGMRGAVVAYHEETSYDGFYATNDPKNIVKTILKTCRASSTGELARHRGARFGGILVGSGLTGFGIRVDALPLVTIRSVSTNGCTDTPGPPTESTGSFNVAVLPALEDQRRHIRFAHAGIHFGDTFSVRLRFDEDLPRRPAGEGWTQTDSEVFRLRVVFFRCPGTSPCAEKAVPDSYFAPL